VKHDLLIVSPNQAIVKLKEAVAKQNDAIRKTKPTPNPPHFVRGRLSQEGNFKE